MTTARQTTVVGVFDDDDQARRAIDALKRAGFREDQIGFIRRHGDGSPADDETKPDTGKKVARGVVGREVLGGILGAAVSLLIPDFGPAIAGGILAETLGGVADRAAGGIIGALTDMGVPEEEARYHQGEIDAGRVIVTVRADGRAQEARDILRQNGAHDATDREGRYGPNAPAGKYEPSAAPGAYDPNATPRRDDDNLPPERP
jgi:Heat induced stress protein YflT